MPSQMETVLTGEKTRVTTEKLSYEKTNRQSLRRLGAGEEFKEENRRRGRKAGIAMTLVLRNYPCHSSTPLLRHSSATTDPHACTGGTLEFSMTIFQIAHKTLPTPNSQPCSSN